MCIPAGVAAGASLVMGAASAYSSAKASKTQAQIAQQQAKLDAATGQQQAQLANFNADQALAYGDLNADMVTSIAGINSNLTKGISDLNIKTISATSDFNYSVAQGNASIIEAQGNAQAATSGINARYLDILADQTLEAGNQQERQSRAQYAGLKSTQRAGFASSGVTLDEGSALRVISDTDYLSDVDAATIKTNALRQALGYKLQAVNQRAAGAMASLNAKAQADSTRIQALGDKIAASTAIVNENMTTSYALLQNEANAKITAANIKTQAKASAFDSRVSALNYSSQAAQASITGKSISPNAVFSTSLAAGAAGVANQWYNYSKAGVWG
ncbi:hypothetical protein JessAGP_041c [Caulobacter phage Jess A]|nr:hypothetical protein JessAGP_041c [Caulobacter phage Jess A]WCA46450.1 hypothetical protein [Caulobacter phage RapA]